VSKNINVNPGQYKVAGRERQGENLVQERERRRLREAEAAQVERAARTRPRRSRGRRTKRTEPE
jgi:hypothetical protein